jgi:tRNA modification GTPase
LIQQTVVVAPATPRGQSALAVVRLTGSELADVVDGFVRPISPQPLGVGRPRRVELFDDSGVFDDGIMTLYARPRTYTGEDLAEITCHGNPLIVERLLAAAMNSGARMAEPGEFTRRAFLNGKTDLLRAEAVLQVSTATTARGLQVGRDGLDGRLTSFVEDVEAVLNDAAAELEARLDYPADELTLVEDATLVTDLEKVANQCEVLADTHAVGCILVGGARVALVGAVNAGKSSLFNALLQRERALVHNEPGTTRDVLEIPTVFGGVAVTLLDTAGERQTADFVEAAGQALSQRLVEDADLLLVVIRASTTGLCSLEREILERTANRPRLVVYNGVDLVDAAGAPNHSIATVATTGLGVEELKAQVVASLVGEENEESRLVIASARQRDRFHSVAGLLRQAVQAIDVAGVAVAGDLVLMALEELAVLSGAEVREKVLDTLFSRFCVGK